MQKWEYKHYEICGRGYVNLKLSHDDFRDLFLDSPSVSRTEEEKHVEGGNIVHYEDLMKILGNDGWELVCVVEEDGGKKEMFFKRKIEMPTQH